MFDDYKKGVTLGLIINWLIHIITNLVLNLNEDPLDYWKFIIPSIICVLLYAVMKFLEPKIKKFVSKIASKYIISNTIARLLVGCGLSTILVSVFVYVVSLIM